MERPWSVRSAGISGEGYTLCQARRIKKPKIQPSGYRYFENVTTTTQDTDTVHVCRSCAVRSKCETFDRLRTARCVHRVQALPPVVPLGQQKRQAKQAAQQYARTKQHQRKKRRHRTSVKMRSNWPSRFNGPPCQGGLCTPK